MKDLHRRAAVFTALLILGLATTSAALAEDPNLNPAGAPAAAAAVAQSTLSGGTPNVTSPDGVGNRRTGTWIDATKFGGRLNSTAPQLTYDLDHYYSAPGAASNEGYFAPIELEPGVSVDGFSCVYNNSSVTHNVSGSFQKHHTDFSTTPPTRTGTLLASFSGTLNEGIAFRFTSLPAAETISYTDGIFLMNNYHLRVDVAADTSLAGCVVWWNRQISPAPASASFTDVPTSYWAFQYIEALKASGITAGVTPTTYEPESPVTRAQMAVFLAKALGLYWAY